MLIFVYKWSDTKVDIFDLMEFASRSKLNMINSFEVVLSLGKMFPNVNFGRLSFMLIVGIFIYFVISVLIGIFKVNK